MADSLHVGTLLRWCCCGVPSLPRTRRTFRLVVAVGFISGLLIIENVKHFDSRLSYRDKNPAPPEGMRRRHTMSIEDSPRPRPPSYPEEDSACHPATAASNHTFIEYIRATQGRRQQRIRSVCDKCRAAPDYMSAQANRAGDGDPSRLEAPRRRQDPAPRAEREASRGAGEDGAASRLQRPEEPRGPREDADRPRREQPHSLPGEESAAARLERLEEEQPNCEQLTGFKLKRHMLNHILVDDAHKVLYCAIPKVGCTTMKRIISKLSGLTGGATDREMHVHDEDYLETLGLRYLSRYDVNSVEHRLKHYFKFMVVRHPLERLLSAYRDKFTSVTDHNVHFHLKYGRRIVRKFRHKPSRKSLKYGHDVTFREFVQYIVSERGSEDFNPHWRPFTQLCYPAHIHYDFTGKFETLNKDMRFVLHRMDPAACPLHFPELLHKPTSHHYVHEYFANISASDMTKLYTIYKNDFLLYGYAPLPLTVTVT